MKIALKIEEVAEFLLAASLFLHLSGNWVAFVVLILLPDIGMIGYLAGNKIGAATYNLCHHKGVAILLGILGLALMINPLIFLALIFYAHPSMDRALGFGLKLDSGFKDTHLGHI